MDDKQKLAALFAQSGIEGLDFEGGLSRFGGNAKLYLKVLKTFVDSIGAHLDRLNEMVGTGATEDYAIEVHGVKGSCYGIAANREGDMAKDLEFAARAGDFGRIADGNDAFIAQMRSLSGQLCALLEAACGGEGAKEKRPAPDRAALIAMLDASRAFDAERMQDVLRELERYDYETGAELVKFLGEQITAFGYDRITERLESAI